VNSRPLILSPEALEHTQKPERIHERGLYPVISECMLEIEKRFGPVPFVPSDTQSPVDVVTTIVDSQTCMIAMFEQKSAVHRLMQFITESIIEITNYQKSLVTQWQGSGHDYPISRGIHLSDDAAAYLSPSVYRAFGLPYNEQLAAAFGGVTLHCCMKYQHNLKIMAGTKGFLGFDPQIAYNDQQAVLDAVQGRGFWRIYHVPDGADKEDYYKDLIDRTVGLCGLMLEVQGDSMDHAFRLADCLREYATAQGRA
jgi:uroporphyrinogen-III decarboxylase